MAKPRKVKNKVHKEGNNTGEVVLTAIKKLTQNTGWTTRTIVKFIKMEYKLSDVKLSQRVGRALKRGVRLGLLQAMGGRYRLNDMSRLVRANSSVVKTNQASLRHRLRPLTLHSRSPSSD